MTADPMAIHIARLRAALAAREGAAAAFAHSPNAENESRLRHCDETLNYRLEQMWACMTDEQRAEADARVLVTA